MWVFCVLYVCALCMCSAHGGQKRAMEPLELVLQMLPYGCWEPNPGPLRSLLSCQELEILNPFLRNGFSVQGEEAEPHHEPL